MMLGKVHEATDARGKGGAVAHVETSGIEGVTRQHHARATIVECDACHLVPRNREHIEHAAAEVEGRLVGRPVHHAKEGAHTAGVVLHHGHVRAARELLVSRDMIGMRVTVRDHERHGRTTMPLAPIRHEAVHRGGDGHAPRAGVEEQRAVRAEQQVEKGLLEARARRLTENVEIRRGAMHGELRRHCTGRTAGVPRGRHHDRFHRAHHRRRRERRCSHSATGRERDRDDDKRAARAAATEPHPARQRLSGGRAGGRGSLGLLSPPSCSAASRKLTS